MTFHYFAYGSNMLPARLVARCPSARVIGAARADGFALTFSKRSKDGSGKATLVPRSGSSVTGVLFEIDEAERQELDQHEGVGSGYRRIDDFAVEGLANAARISVAAYIADALDPALEPFDWYLAIVIAGAAHHGFEDAILASLRAEKFSIDQWKDRPQRRAALDAMRFHGIDDYRRMLGPTTSMPSDFDIVRAVIEAGSPALAAFDYLIAHAQAAGFVPVPRLSRVRSIELQWRDRRQNPFSAQVNARYVNFYVRRPALNLDPGLFDAAVATFGAVTPNGLGEYRKHLATVVQVDAMLAFLRERGAWPASRAARRFVKATFAPVTGEHFLRAAQRLREGFSEHRFGPSTDYDLLFDGHRLPPKAVFGLAAAEALGFPVLPGNFSAGEGMLCFRMLRANGYEIVPKGEAAEADPALVSDEDRVWAEGAPRLVSHLRRERGTGLAAAKRDQFRAAHGRLFCERCLMDPLETFGSELGEACIEVHHRDTRVADMTEGHQTRLEDLQCLCANCHRVTHRELKAMITTPSS